MSSGHASHKGPGIKQSHDSGQIDSAATTPAANPEELLEGEPEGYPFNAQGTQPNPQAVERPQADQGKPAGGSDRPEQESSQP